MSKEFNTVFTGFTGFAALVSPENISKLERQRQRLGTGQKLWDLRLPEYKMGRRMMLNRQQMNVICRGKIYIYICVCMFLKMLLIMYHT